MDLLNSFKGYGKVDPAEDRAFRHTSRKRLVIISVSIFLLLAIIVGAAIGIATSRKSDSGDVASPSPSSVPNAIKLICSITLYPDTCFASLSSVAANSSVYADPQELFKLSLRVAMTGLGKVADLPRQLASRVNDSRLKQALDDCSEEIQDSIDLLNQSLSLLVPARGEKMLTESKIADLVTWLSAVLTDLDTCYDGLDGTKGGFREKLEAALKNSTAFASNSLAIASHLLSLREQLHIPIHRKLLTLASPEPKWVLQRSRLLQEGVKADVMVAQDGTGDVKTITEALARVPKKNTKPFVIKVKGGKYDEVVRVEKGMWNVVLIGDGIGKSIITGRRSVSSGFTTFNTASFGESDH